jgi:pimeloyl-ACP methyl ester carboxylesterase
MFDKMAPWLHHAPWASKIGPAVRLRSANNDRWEGTMTIRHLGIAAIIAILLQLGAGGPSSAASPAKGTQIGTTFPDNFPLIGNFYLGKPVIGFGSDAGRVERIPVVFVHGNNDSPFPTACNPFGRIQAFAQFFLDNGYHASELWGLGYQGDQCDLAQDNTHRSGISHTTAVAVPMLRQFVQAVLDFTGAKRVDIVAHSLGVTIAREWMLQDNAYRKVRALVAIDGPNHGIIDCSPSPANFYQLVSGGGFTPSSAVCDEVGSDHTQLLSVLNGTGETPGPTHYLVIRNKPGTPDFVYNSLPDGSLPGVPAEDRDGNPHDFTESAGLAGAKTIDLSGQGQYDPVLGTAHLGILNSPDSRSAALQFLTSLPGRPDQEGDN